jgi:hypothetical protein
MILPPCNARAAEIADDALLLTESEHDNQPPARYSPKKLPVFPPITRIGFCPGIAHMHAGA